jgi:hypothetical protein
VVRPAAAAGCAVQTTLVTRLVAETAEQPAALPLLSHVLLETWKRRRGMTLTVQGYEETGGLAHAIARSAEHAYLALAEPDRAVARWVFLRLVAVGEGTGDTKRRATRGELDSLGGQVGPVLDAPASARLVAVGDDVVEPAHEALLHAWPRLRGWVAEDREGLRLQRQLTVAAGIWAELDRDPGSLYRTTRLALATAWVQRARPALTERERDFLEHSRLAEARERPGGRHPHRRPHVGDHLRCGRAHPAHREHAVGPRHPHRVGEAARSGRPGGPTGLAPRRHGRGHRGSPRHRHAVATRRAPRRRPGVRGRGPAGITRRGTPAAALPTHRVGRSGTRWRRVLPVP